MRTLKDSEPFYNEIIQLIDKYNYLKAIKYGASHVRIGSAIFGSRS